MKIIESKSLYDLKINLWHHQIIFSNENNSREFQNSFAVIYEVIFEELAMENFLLQNSILHKI